MLNSLKHLSGKNICYVTLNKSSKVLRKDFKKNNIELKNITIIDAISKTVNPLSKAEKNCFFVSSPKALTELATSIGKCLENSFEYFIFDSLNSLLVYQKLPVVKKWISSIMKKIKDGNAKAIFYTLNLGEQQELIDETSLFADKVISLEKNHKVKKTSVLTGKLSGEMNGGG
jgi:hypothetical protein